MCYSIHIRIFKHEESIMNQYVDQSIALWVIFMSVIAFLQGFSHYI